MKHGAWDLGAPSDDELLRRLHSVRNAERGAVVLVVAHLAEVEERRLHLRTGSSSMFDYCLRRLGMSENEAFRRVTAARLARRYPVILEMLAAGDIHLYALGALRDHLTKENHSELLGPRARRRSRSRSSSRGDSRKRMSPARSASCRRLDRSAPPPVAPSLPPKPRTIVEPRSEDRYRLQLDTSAELKRKLELARDSMSHTNPSGDFSVVIERALDLLIDKLQREHFAQAKRERSQPPANPGSRYIPSAVRRAVIERDGLQCSYVSPDGERCTSRKFLQFHHEHAWALGGRSTADNCRLFCASHNQLVAEQDFGKQRVAAKIAEARAQRRVDKQGERKQTRERSA